MSLQTVKSQAKYGLINKKTSSASSKWFFLILCIFKIIDDRLFFILFSLVPQRASKVASVFASAEEDSYLENDDEEAISSGSFSRGQSEIARASKVILSSAKSTSASSLRDSLAADIDTSIYDYDGQYDDFKKESESKRSTSHKLSSNNDSKVSHVFVSTYRSSKNLLRSLSQIYTGIIYRSLNI